MKFETKTLLDGMKKVEERQTVRTSSGRVDIEVFEDYRGVVVSLVKNTCFSRAKQISDQKFGDFWRKYSMSPLTIMRKCRSRLTLIVFPSKRRHFLQ